jgi:hypothetical protein
MIIAGFSVTTLAQNEMQDVVYLKNGSVIRGIIIEQIPNESLKIQTVDENIFAYNISEVAKITKEAIKNNRTRKNNSNNYGSYRGFVDIGYTIGIRTDINCGRLELTTSQGYQFNPYLFLGLGVGAHYFIGPESYAMPIFADIRANFSRGKVIPFSGLKIGYVAGERNGLYLNSFVGGKFMITSKFAFNLSFGYTYQYAEDWSNFDDEDISGLSIKLGIEF